jgi:hypothetical protein
MSDFSELLEHKLGDEPGDNQKRAKRKFPALAQQHGLKVYEPGQPLPSSGNLILIGVAAGFSVYDLSLLDEITASGDRSQLQDVAIFDASLFTSMEDFEKFIPGIIPVHHTPVVGVWENGKLIAKLKGPDARVFLRRHFSTVG